MSPNALYMCLRFSRQQHSLPILSATIAYQEPAIFAQAFKEQEIRLTQVEVENAEIQHRLEAIDMETAANTAEIERFSNGHGMWFSVAGWCNRHGIKKPVQWLNTQGRKAAAMCKQKGLKPVPVPDARFGQVNSYPDSILAELNWD